MKVQKLVEMGFPEALVNKTLEAVGGELRMMAFEQEELWENASERITWHEKLEGEQAIQNRVHELVSVGNLNAAVNLLLSTPPESSYLYPNALRAVALSSAVSTSLNELAVKVVAANMVRTDRSLSGTHLLCAVGRYQEACLQLQDAGCWTDAATIAVTHLKGTDYARVMHRWAGYVLNAEHNIWRHHPFFSHHSLIVNCNASFCFFGLIEKEKSKALEEQIRIIKEEQLKFQDEQAKYKEEQNEKMEFMMGELVRLSRSQSRKI